MVAIYFKKLMTILMYLLSHSDLCLSLTVRFLFTINDVIINEVILTPARNFFLAFARFSLQFTNGLIFFIVNTHLIFT